MRPWHRFELSLMSLLVRVQYVIAVIIPLPAALSSSSLHIHPSHPIDRLNGNVEEANASVLPSSVEKKDLLATPGRRIIQISRFCYIEALPTNRATLAKNIAKPNNAAYVMFTSGSTAKAKGVVVEHQAWCSNALAHGKAMQITSSSRVLQFSSFFYGVFLLENTSHIDLWRLSNTTVAGDTDPKTIGRPVGVRSMVSKTLTDAMIPTCWAVIDVVPTDMAKEVNRATLAQWLNDASNGEYRGIMAVSSGMLGTQRPASGFGGKFREIVSSVLG
ncbi:Bassianolide nonribosomal cyclodepsipeptide synthetase [Cladobotryum mycophilum]|uniref:Bassianolide nonribosomal cyclodepsipeptide synthetase n=1 Tax=Cladobotryum mycophilum TaxID=491253 RepID=A0ABR0SW90_9HYPO